MDFELKALGPAQAARDAADALVVLVPEGAAAAADDALSALLGDALASGHFEPKPGRQLAAFRVAGIRADRVVLAGAGGGTARDMRKAVLAAIPGFKGAPVRRLTVYLWGSASPEAVAAVVQAVQEASYAYTATRSKPEPRVLTRVRVGLAAAEVTRRAFEEAVAIADGVEWAREWGNRPANHATPSQLAEAARALASRGSGVRCEVLGPREVAELGMGAFMAVAQGSHEPLRFIVLRYQGVPKSEAPVVLVGKGITFDTGGISIKPAPEMDEMKYDMSGAASVLGVFRALSRLKPATHVIGLIPACENMPDGRAVKPGDVVRSLSGQTIEILNTDAEGRLVLCDALTYAQRFSPAALIDVATLTGACVIALGGVRSGLFATDDGLAAALHQAGETALDPCWRLPLDDDYAEGLKTPFADVANVGGRPAGAVTAAKFLQRFVGDTPWAHLDIAGTAWKGGAAKGSTGRPVGLLMRYLLDRPATPPAAGKRRPKR